MRVVGYDHAMSMILGFTTISDENIARVFAFPPLVWKFIAPDDPEAFEQDAARHRQSGFLARLFRKQPPPADEELVLRDGEGVDEDLDKAWHGLHYLLTGTAWEGAPPLNFLLAGGRELPGSEVGYGPARVLTSTEVLEVAGALDRVSEEWLRGRFDAADMMAKEIYPEIWDRNPAEDDTLGYCIEGFQMLKKLFGSAAAEKFGFIITIQ